LSTEAAAAELGPLIHAAVSRGGRPNLAQSALTKVISPALLIIGSLDIQVISLNEVALNLLNALKKF